jgi:poly-beta-hydroxyalkanoate depolymerase
VQLRGRVSERRTDADFKVMDRISRKYTGKDFPMRDNPVQRVVLVIEVERVRFVRLPFAHTPA